MYLSLINKTCYSELQKQIYWERAFTNYLSNVPGDKNNLKEQYMSDILYIKAENRKEKETIKLVRIFYYLNFSWYLGETTLEKNY